MAEPLDVKELFSQAVVLPPDLRAEFLDLIGARDAGLRDQLEQLLAFNEGEDPLLDQPISAALGLAEPEFESGDILKRRYKIERSLGRGGFSHVYLARDIQMHGKRVVVKVLTAAPKGWDGEIQALARINHPSVLDALDWGVAGSGHPFLISEYIEGVTLREALEKGPLPLERTVRIITEVAEGLEAAHRQGVLHLDIKPENIVLSEPGSMGERASVIDFGIAHLADAVRSVNLAGSPGYMAPEMRIGQNWAGCDVYALGMLTFEMLTGTLPDPAVFVGKQLPQLAPKAPAGVVDAIVDATLPDPRKRLGSARQFASQLNHAFERSRRAPKGKIAVAAMASLFAVASLARYTSRQPSGAGAQPLTTYPLAERHPEFSPDGKRIFYSGTNPNAGDLDIYTQLVGQPKRLRLTITSSDEIAPACSPDGKWIAFLRRIGSQTAIVVIPSGGGAENAVAEGFYDSVTWGGTSRLLASERPAGADPSRLVKIDLGTREVSPLLDSVGQHDSAPSLSPDGHTVAFVRQSAPGQSDLYLVSVDPELRALADPRRITYHDAAIRHPQWMPDSKEIVYASGPLDGSVLWRVRRDGTGEPREIIESRKGADDPAIPRNAWKLAFSADLSDSNIWRVTLDSPGGRVIREAQAASSSMRERYPRLSPDARSVSLVSTRSGSAQVWVGQLEGGEELQKTFLEHSDDLRPFWVDDQWLGLGLSNHGLSFCVLPREGRSIQKSRDDGFAVGASRDGKHVYVLGSGDNPGLWRAPVDGGPATRISAEGAIFAAEAPGGKDVYVSRLNPPGVWRVPIAGGAETQVLGSIADPSSFAVEASGVYYVSAGRPHSIRLRRPNGSDTEVYRLRGGAAPGLDVSADERTIVFAQLDAENVDIMMIDPLR